MKRQLTAGLVGILLLAPPVHGYTVGSPSCPVGEWQYSMAAIGSYEPHEQDGVEYITEGYILKGEAGLPYGVDVYGMAGQHRIKVPETKMSTELIGDSRVSYGVGVKFKLPLFLDSDFSSFLDVGTFRFKSAGNLDVATGSPRVVTGYRDRYNWREYQTAFGVRKDGDKYSPYGGTRLAWFDVEITRSQPNGDPPKSTIQFLDGPNVTAFAGLDVELAPGIKVFMEMSRDHDAGLAYTIGLGEITR